VPSLPVAKIHGDLGAESIRGPRAPARGVCVALHHAVLFRDEPRQAGRAEVAHPTRHLGPVDALLFERDDRLVDVIVIDVGEGLAVRRGDIAHVGRRANHPSRLRAFRYLAGSPFESQ
jgi:hypothetical protein